MNKPSVKNTFRRREPAPANWTAADTLAPQPQPSAASPAKRPARIRRRWSVAELIVQAAARPPATGACA